MIGKFTIVLAVIVLVVGGGLFFTAQKKSPAQSALPTDLTTPGAVTNTGFVADKTNKKDSPDSQAETGYLTYSKEAFEKNNNKRRVYFFHASWCPTCRAADQEYVRMASRIPQDVVVFKIDYDSAAELKKRYAVTYQHTFVQVDANGNEVARWNGGGVDELLTNLK